MTFPVGRIIALAVLAATVGVVASCDAQTPSPVSTTTAMEKAVFSQINQYRTGKGLPPLTLDARVSAQARAHSQNMASRRILFGHSGFEERVAAISRILPLSSAAENVSVNDGYKDPATVAVKGWLKSPGHLKNIEARYGADGLTGIGVARDAKGGVYFTQIFIQRR